MKKALVLSLAFVLGLGIASFAQTLTGEWNTTVGITFADQTVSYAGETITIPEQVLDCVGGSVTVPDQDIDVTVNGQTVTVTIPGGTYDTTELGETVTIPDQDVDVTIADVDLTISVPGGTYDCTGGQVTIPAYDIVIAGHSHVITNIPVFAIDSTLIVTYTVSGWHFTSKTVLDENGWTEQLFDVGGALGMFTIGSVLTFDPTVPEFTSWVVDSGISLSGVTFTSKFTLDEDGTTLQIVGAGTAGTVGVKATLDLGSGEGCNFDFNGVAIEVKFDFCCAKITSTIEFNCEGFEFVKFVAGPIAIPNLPWLSINAALTFTTTSKDLVLTPKFDFGAPVCFTLYISQVKSGNLELGAFQIGGIGLTCPIGPVKFEGISWWGPGGTKPTVLGPYWEMYKITTKDDGCCGPFNFSIAAFFAKDSLELFDVSKFVASMDIKVATQFKFLTSLTIDLAQDPAFTTWTVGFEVKW